MDYEITTNYNPGSSGDAANKQGGICSGLAKKVLALKANDLDSFNMPAVCH